MYLTIQFCENYVTGELEKKLRVDKNLKITKKINMKALWKTTLFTVLLQFFLFQLRDKLSFAKQGGGVEGGEGLS